MAKMLGISVPFLIKLRRQKRIPYYKIGEAVRYEPRKMKEVIEKFAVEEEI
jgi:excisionase family DNA binding protein